MYTRILVPLDGSPRADLILPHASEIARRFDATVVLMQVITARIEALQSATSAEPLTMATVPISVEAGEEVAEVATIDAEHHLEVTRRKLEADGVHVEILIEEGTAVMTIEDAVQSEHIDLVALTTKGRSALGRLFFGSITESVLHDIHVPVLVLHPPD